MAEDPRHKDVVDLAPSDFTDFEFWTWDDEADNGTVVPIREIPLCANGDRDVDALFCKCQVSLADGSKWDAVVGLSGEDLFAYVIDIFLAGSYSITINTAASLKGDLREICSFFGSKPKQIFPIKVEHDLASLQHRVVRTIEIGDIKK